MPSPISPQTIDEVAVRLKDLLGPRATDAAAIREHHSHGESYHPAAAPDIVCFPSTPEEVVEIVRISAEYQVPIVPFGAGTSLEGHVHALRGGICIDCRDLNRVLRISVEDLDATVEAGVTRLQLNKALRNTGLMFPIDPGADATLGGMTATRASGTTAVRYGTMRENVLGLTAVLADGRLVRMGTRARKSAAGYDLTRLFVGSEGTLGVITDVTLRLHPVPEAVAAAVCAFDSIKGAVDTVIATIQLGVPVARGGRGFVWATRLVDRERLWHARHNVHFASLALRPGCRAWATDVCVPISRLSDCIMETKAEHADLQFPVCLVGHAGDGNFHVIYLLDPSSDEELAIARRLNDRIVARALAMGGTCTGEHGVGYGKMKSLEAEHGEGVDVMRAIKRALDPENLMNPGKVVDI